MNVKKNLADYEGDNMFVNRIGNEIKKELDEATHKAHCMGDAESKADDKKKPAHGMVIVIGSKAGPGPSKNGKREKKDSEKKD